ncbi:MAG: AraC family transcriptional regulator [Steroidobacteraceae bacterium]
MPEVPSPLARRPAGRRLIVPAALLAGLVALAAAPATFAQSPPPAASQPVTAQPAAATSGGSVDEQVQSLKSDVLNLNRDLFVLEQELLYPANTQVAVFVSIDAGTFFALDTVQLKIDGKEVADYLYTPREVHALVQGGVQRLYVGNLKVGKHELVAFFTGKGPHNLDYTRGATLEFQKDIGAKYLELTITDDQKKLQPQFRIKDWD